MEGNLYFIREKKALIVKYNIKQENVVDFIIEHNYCGIPDMYEVKEYPPFTQYIFSSDGIVTQFAFSTLSHEVAKAEIEEVNISYGKSNGSTCKR